MGDFHRLDDAVHDHCRAESGPQAEKQHASALVAADCLHRGVVHDQGRPAKGFAEIESNPASTEIVRLRDHLAVQDGPGIADRDRIEFPALDEAAHACDHLRRLETRSLTWLPPTSTASIRFFCAFI
jgi:hypothetical protein